MRRLITSMTFIHYANVISKYKEKKWVFQSPLVFFFSLYRSLLCVCLVSLPPSPLSLFSLLFLPLSSISLPFSLLFPLSLFFSLSPSLSLSLFPSLSSFFSSLFPSLQICLLTLTRLSLLIFISISFHLFLF